MTKHSLTSISVLGWTLLHRSAWLSLWYFYAIGSSPCLLDWRRLHRSGWFSLVLLSVIDSSPCYVLENNYVDQLGSHWCTLLNWLLSVQLRRLRRSAWLSLWYFYAIDLVVFFYKRFSLSVLSLSVFFMTTTSKEIYKNTGWFLFIYL